MKKEQRKTKMERLILGLKGPCLVGKQRAARRYKGLSLQQAWKKANRSDLKSFCEALKVRSPIQCKVGCGPTCWGNVWSETGDDIRKLLRGRIPAAVQKAWKSA